MGVVSVFFLLFFKRRVRSREFQGSTCNVKEAPSSLGGLSESREVDVLGREEVDCQKGGIYLVDVAQWIQFQTRVRRTSTCIYWGGRRSILFLQVLVQGTVAVGVCTHI